jgi:hypothetical protein
MGFDDIDKAFRPKAVVDHTFESIDRKFRGDAPAAPVCEVCEGKGWEYRIRRPRGFRYRFCVACDNPADLPKPQEADEG